MRKASLVIIAMMLALMAVGCSDDDAPGPVAPNTGVTHLVVGEAIIRGYVSFSGMISTFYGQENEIDSILFGDSLCSIFKVPSGIEGTSYYYGFSYNNQNDTQYSSGDEVAINFFTETETVTTNLKLLTVPEDTIVFTFPPPGFGLHYTGGHCPLLEQDSQRRLVHAVHQPRYKCQCGCPPNIQV